MKISIGSQVRIRFQDGQVKVMELTNNSQRIAPEKGVVSAESPLGRALLGHISGDALSYTVGSKKFMVEVISIIP